MHKAQISIHPEPGEKQNDIMKRGNTDRYNLCPSPVRPRQQFNLLQTEQQLAFRMRSKPNAHKMMTQMSFKAAIEKFGQKEVMPY